MEKGKKHVAIAVAALLTAGTAATTWAASARIESIDRNNGMVTLKLSPSMARNMREGESVRVTSPLPSKHRLRGHHAHAKKPPMAKPGAAPGTPGAPGATPGGAPEGQPGSGS